MKVFGSLPVLFLILIPILIVVVVVVVFKRKTFCGKCEQSVEFTNWKSLLKLEVVRGRGRDGNLKLMLLLDLLLLLLLLLPQAAALELMLQMGHKSRRGCCC